MGKISKYIKLDKNILLEYIYNDENLISEPYSVLIDSRNNNYSYISGINDTSLTNNSLKNQLFKIDQITNKFGKINTNNYSFLQVKNYSSGSPIQHDTLKIHIPSNWTFGEWLGFYVRVYALDVNSQKTFDLSNYYFDISDVDQKQMLNFTSPPLFFQEKNWSKNISIDIPSLNFISNQKVGNNPKENSINSNLTNLVGFNTSSPIFIDFQFISKKQTINSIDTYILNSKTSTTLPQTPEYDSLGLKIEHSKKGDFFEIFGTYNNTITGFKQFIDDSFYTNHRYYVQYDITIYEQNIRGKTITFTVTDSFNESIEFRPIIKYSTTTAVIDVEMRLIDDVDESIIIRKASYGMLQDEVSKYSLKLMKIDISNANKPKIYNIKNNISRDNMFGDIVYENDKINSNSLMKNSSNSNNSNGSNNQTNNNGISNSSQTVVETVQIPFPVLVDKFNIIGKSENTILNKEEFYGIGKIVLLLYPFDNIVKMIIASGDANKPEYLNLTKYGDIKLVIKNDTNSIDFPLYINSNDINLSIGQIAFKLDKSKFPQIKNIYNSGINVFYITSDLNGLTTVIYSGLFKIYDNVDNVNNMNNNAATSGSTLAGLNNPSVITSPNQKTGTAVVTISKKL